MTMNAKQARIELNKRIKQDPQNVVGMICDRLAEAAKAGQIESVADIRLIYNDAIGEIEQTIIDQDLEQF
jgi:hypothetical protein